MIALQAFAEHLAAGVLNSLPAGIALVVLTSLLLRFMRGTSSSARFVIWFSTLAALPFLGLLHAPGSQLDDSHAGLNIPSDWALPAIAIWAVIASAILLRIAMGLWRIYRIRKSCVPVVPAGLSAAIVEQLSNTASSRKVQVCTSHLVQVPAAVGIYKPAIVLPEWALTDLTSQQLAVIICHELAHLRRWDDWSNLAQKVLRAVFFFHPAAWWIERQLSLEREMACDDEALLYAASAREYAQSLVAVAEKSMLRRSLLMAQAAVHRARETSLRIARLLKVGGKTNQRAWTPAAVILGVLSAAMFVIEPGMPQWIAFHDDSSAVAARNVPARPEEESIVRRAAQLAPSPEMLVIFQNASFDQHGNSTWNVYVLRVKWTGDVQVLNREPSKRT